MNFLFYLLGAVVIVNGLLNYYQKRKLVKKYNLLFKEYWDCLHYLDRIDKLANEITNNRDRDNFTVRRIGHKIIKEIEDLNDRLVMTKEEY